jgi:8-amino-7-oxononanoate synthase
LCTTLTRDYLVNYARTLIYTTAMASPTLVAIRVAYELMQQGKTQPVRAQRGNIFFFFRVLLT